MSHSRPRSSLQRIGARLEDPTERAGGHRLESRRLRRLVIPLGSGSWTLASAFRFLPHQLYRRRPVPYNMCDASQKAPWLGGSLIWVGVHLPVLMPFCGESLPLDSAFDVPGLRAGRALSVPMVCELG